MEWNPIALWQRLSTPEKVAVAAGLLGIAVFAYIQYNKNKASSSASAGTSANVTTVGSGATTIQQLLGALGVDGSTSQANVQGGNVPQPVAGGVATSTTPAPADNSTANAQIPQAQAPAVSNTAPAPPVANTSNARYVTAVEWHPNDTANDTLVNIAANNNVAGGWQRLWGLNPQITDPNTIYAGEQIRIA